MLRPRSYPELIGKALVLEAQPFEVMVDDDEPWAEGLALILVVGLVIGVAQVVGGLLFTGVMPPANALWATILNGWQEFSTRLALAPDAATAGEASLRQAWTSFRWYAGYAQGWSTLLRLVITPVGLMAQWMVTAAIVFVVARGFGGRGTFNQTLGASALMVAPQVLLTLQILPFANVNSLLPAAWGMLILYRAVEVTHDLPWRQAAVTAVTPYALLALLLTAGGVVASLALMMGGGA